MLSQHLKEYAQEKYAQREVYLEPIRAELEQGLAACTEEEQTLMKFFYGTMPLRDAGEYDFRVFLSYVTHALWLRDHVDWCKELSEELFVHYVLYYRINSEDISECRAFFYEQLKERIAGLSLEEAILEINYWCAEHVVYQAADGRTASPMTMYRGGKGRCGEESTFTATVLRSVGIPARQVYAPRWTHCDDNHAWVEVYLNGEWHFLGACEPEEVLDRGWFTGPASRALLVHSRRFSDYGSQGTEELVSREGAVWYYNSTSIYAKTGKLTVRVKDAQGEPVVGARVLFQILNMAEYYDAATLISDERGEASITLGLGDILVRVLKDGSFCEELVNVQGDQVAELTLSAAASATEGLSDKWETVYLHAPKEYAMHPVVLCDEQEARKEQRCAEAVEKRESRFAECFQADPAAAYPEENEMLHIAGENFSEVYAFLSKDAHPDRKAMLHSLTVKDYKDLKADILEDHLKEYRCLAEHLTEADRRKYLLCPRIYLEELTPYRSYIRKYFSEGQLQSFAEEPQRIWSYIQEHIQDVPELDYPTLLSTPVGCLKLKVGNPLSQRILFVAICRSIGIPARLEWSELMPQYDTGAGFRTLSETGGTDIGQAKLHLQAGADDAWGYFQKWTLGKWKDGVFQSLNYWGLPVKEGAELTLDPGLYRILITNRQANGDQQVTKLVFSLDAGEEKSYTLGDMEMDLQEQLGSVSLAEWMAQVSLQTEDGGQKCLADLAGSQPLLLACMGVGAEPTEHVLNELLEDVEGWNRAGIRTLFLLRDLAELSNPTLSKVLAQVQGIEIYYADRSVATGLAVRMQVDETKLPILTAVDQKQCGIHAYSGYNVGSVNMLKKIMSTCH